MDLITIKLLEADSQENPISLTLSRSTSLKTFLDIAEKALKIEIFTLYVNNKRLTDISQLNEGDVILASNIVPSQYNRSSYCQPSEDLQSFMSDHDDNAVHIKVVVMGPEAAGKTSMVLRFILGFFKSNDSKTLVESEYDKYIQVGRNNVNMSILDTAGELTDEKISRTWIADKNAYILAIGVDQLDQWPVIIEYQKIIRKLVRQPNIFVLVTKIDLIDKMGKGQLNSTKEQLGRIETHCKERHLLLFKTSAKANKRVHDIFVTIANRCIIPEEVERDKLEDTSFYKQPGAFKFMNGVVERLMMCCKLLK